MGRGGEEERGGGGEALGGAVLDQKLRSATELTYSYCGTYVETVVVGATPSRQQMVRGSTRVRHINRPRVFATNSLIDAQTLTMDTVWEPLATGSHTRGWAATHWLCLVVLPYVCVAPLAAKTDIGPRKTTTDSPTSLS